MSAAPEVERCAACGGYLRQDMSCAEDCADSLGGDDDGLAAARGIAIAVLVGIALWTIGVAVLWLVTT